MANTTRCLSPTNTVDTVKRPDEPEPIRASASIAWSFDYDQAETRAVRAAHPENIETADREECGSPAYATLVRSTLVGDPLDPPTSSMFSTAAPG